jgi:hypothetical protein
VCKTLAEIGIKILFSKKTPVGYVSYYHPTSYFQAQLVRGPHTHHHGLRPAHAILLPRLDTRDRLTPPTIESPATFQGKKISHAQVIPSYFSKSEREVIPSYDSIYGLHTSYYYATHFLLIGVVCIQPQAKLLFHIPKHRQVGTCNKAQVGTRNKVQPGMSPSNIVSPFKGGCPRKSPNLIQECLVSLLFQTFLDFS